MNKYTKGPWGIEETQTTLWVGPLRSDSKTKEIVAVFDIDGYTMDYKEKVYANARLIAAAPEMLSALVGVIISIENGFKPDVNGIKSIITKIEQSDK